MDDAEICAIVPRWKRMSKKEREKRFREWQRVSVEAEASGTKPRWYEALERRADVKSGNHIELFRALDAFEWYNKTQFVDAQFVTQGLQPAEAQPAEVVAARDLTRDMWHSLRDTGAVDVGLVTFEPMLALTLGMLLEPLSRWVGSAAAYLQTNEPFYRWIVWVLGDGRDEHTMLDVGPMRYQALKCLWHVLVGSGRRALDLALSERHLADAVLTQMRWGFDNSDYEVLGTACHVLEVMFSPKSKRKTSAVPPEDDDFADQHDGEDGPSYGLATRASVAAQRILTSKAFAPFDGETGAGATSQLCGLVLAAAMHRGVKPSDACLAKLRPVAKGYSEAMPTSPVEQVRWTARYFAKLVVDVDWTQTSDPNVRRRNTEVVDQLNVAITGLVKFRRSNAACAAGTACLQYDADDPDAPLVPATLRCSKCRSAHYCSKACFVNHWPSHKAACKRARTGQLPARFLSLEEGIRHSRAQVGDRQQYPAIFVLWLDAATSTPASAA